MLPTDYIHDKYNIDYVKYKHTHKSKYHLHYRPISRFVIGREVDYYRSRLIYVRYGLTNTTLCIDSDSDSDSDILFNINM